VSKNQRHDNHRALFSFPGPYVSSHLRASFMWLRDPSAHASLISLTIAGSSFIVMARIKRVRVSTSLAEAIKSPVNLRKRRKLTPPPTPPSLPPARPSPFHDPIPIPSNLNVCSDAAVDHLSSHDPRFRMMYEHLACRPFQPPFTAINPFKTLVTSIIGQQVSWMAARAINNKFRKVFGFEDDDGFPGPAEVSGKEVPELKGAGLSTRKAEYGTSGEKQKEGQD